MRRCVNYWIRETFLAGGGIVNENSRKQRHALLNSGCRQGVISPQVDDHLDIFNKNKRLWS